MPSANAAGTTARMWARTRPPHHLRPLHQQPSRHRRKPGVCLNGRDSSRGGNQSTTRSMALWLIWGRGHCGGRPVDQRELIRNHYQWGEHHDHHELLQHRAGPQHRCSLSFLSERGDGSAGCSPVLAPLPAFHHLAALQHPTQKLFCFALASVMGGAIGNVVDRLDARLRGRFSGVPRHAGWHFRRSTWPTRPSRSGAACLIVDELLRARREA